MPKVKISNNDHGKVYVFALSMSDDAAQALDGDQDLQNNSLGAKFVDPKHAEVIRISDLDQLGLAGYLREGVDVNEAEIARDAAKLAAVDGWVMLVYSAAFGGAETTLNPGSELTLIGTYTQEQADRASIPLESEAAAPYTGTPTATPPLAPRGRAGGSLVVVGLAVLVAVILWWAFT